MCGIMGFIGNENAKDIIINGLHALEYRGYDSAGVSLAENGKVNTVKCSGRVSKLEELCQTLDMCSNCGIGHTRWATHGAPSSENAHPHESDTCVLVHNGIIENYLELRNTLSQEGYVFKSETDSESIVHLIDREYKKSHSPKQAVINAMKLLKGAFALAIIFKENDNEIWGCRRDNPLIAASNKNGTFLASDIPALLPHSNEIIRPADDEIILLNGKNITLFDKNGNEKAISVDKITWSIGTAQKDGFDHFMLKEIYEQPKCVCRTASQHTDSAGLPNLSDIGISAEKLKEIDSISIIGCGSATHAGFVGKFIIEQLAGIPVFVTTASEYRYCPPVTVGKTLVLAISQSGETADTLAALRLAKQNFHSTLGIINSVGSAIARESDHVYYTNAGPEIAVATTKGYTTQVTALCVLACAIAHAKCKLSDTDAKKLVETLSSSVPKAIENIISRRSEIKSIAQTLFENNDLYFIGRGIDNYAGIECSLKLKEISYIHSEAYAAGELKHGTLSLIENGTPVIALATDKLYHDKMIGNIREVTSRGGKVTLICSSDFEQPDEYADNIFILPDVLPHCSPLVSVVAIQLLAYEAALLRGCDVDHPRNLAKSVTVE